MKDKLFIILFILLLSCKISSQQVFENINSAKGLSSDKVGKIIQDREGFYWIATTEGLNRFDGTGFKIFRHERNNPASLAHNSCFSLLEDRDGAIWVATYKGISVYRKNENRFQQILLQEEGINSEILNRSIADLALDMSGDIWIAAYGLYKYDSREKKIISFRYHPDYPAEYKDENRIVKLYFDKLNNGIWFQSGAALCFVDINTNNIYHKTNNPMQWSIFNQEMYFPLALDGKNRLWFLDKKNMIRFFDIPKNRVEETFFQNAGSIQSVEVDDRNRLWVSYWNETARIYDHSLRSTDSLFFQQLNSRSVISRSFNHLLVDKENNYWISTNEGISIYNPSKQYFKLHELHITGKGFDKLPFSITAIAPQNDHQLWIGSTMGLFMYETKTGQLDKISLQLPTGYINSLYLDGDSILWIGDRKAVLKYHIGQNKILSSHRLNTNNVQVITKGPRGNIWMGTWSNGLHEISSSGKIIRSYKSNNLIEGSLSSDRLLCLNYTDDELWIGFNRGEEFEKYDPASGLFKHYTSRLTDNANAEASTVNVISPYNKNEIWLGTYGNGIYIWNRRENRFTQMTTEDGLSSDYINSIRKDENGNTWISTANGIDIYNKATQKIISLFPDFGFPSDDFVQNNAYGKNGHLFFFCVNKIIEIDPAKYQAGHFSYPIIITDFRVFDKTVPYSAAEKGIRLTHRQNFFSFEFSCLKPNATEPIQYAYKLEGFDKEWQFAGSRRFATYTNVPGGKYEFKIKAANQKGEWNEQFGIIHIIIAPPLWKRWWFISLATLSLLAGLYFFYLYRITQVKKLYSLRSKISQDLHDEVASTLSGIRLYSEMAKQQLYDQNTVGTQRSLHVISSNANDMAQDMSDIIWTINPSNDSFKKLLQKLKSYATEISVPANMKFDCTIEDHIPEEKLSMEQRRNVYLICKEAINNAVKYSEGKNLSMHVARENHSIKIKIQDDGFGFDKENSINGNGMLNMQERAKEINAGLEIHSQNGKGTVIQLTISL